MAYEFKGILQKVYPAFTGTSKSGTQWTKRGALFIVKQEKWGNIIDTPIYVIAWSKQVVLLSDTCVGQEAEVICRVSCREFQGKWLTDLELDKITFPNMYNDIKPEQELPMDIEDTRYPQLPIGDPGGDDFNDLPF